MNFNFLKNHKEQDPSYKVDVDFQDSFGRKKVLGPVVQSIASLTNPLRGQLVKCFSTL